MIQLQWQTSEFSETKELVQSRVWKMADLDRTEQNGTEQNRIAQLEVTYKDRLT